MTKIYRVNYIYIVISLYSSSSEANSSELLENLEEIFPCY